MWLFPLKHVPVQLQIKSTSPFKFTVEVVRIIEEREVFCTVEVMKSITLVMSLPSSHLVRWTIADIHQGASFFG